MSSDLPGRAISHRDVRPGDLIFFQRPGLVQRLVHWADDLWRHIGIVVEIRGHLWVLEAGLEGYRARPLSTVLRTYRRSSICRLDACEHRCADRLVEVALAAMDVPTTYPTRVELALTGLLSLVRRTDRANGGPLGALVRLAAGRHLGRVERGGARTLCASLVVRSLAKVCGAHARFPNLAVAKTSRVATAFPDRLAGLFALPDDVWRLFDPHSQYWIDDTSACMDSASASEA